MNLLETDNMEENLRESKPFPMSLRTFFRILVVMSPGVALLGIGYEWLATPFHSEDWKTLLEWDGNGGWPSDAFSDDPTAWWETAFFVTGVAAFVTLLLLLLIIHVGLFCFRDWARSPYLYVNIGLLFIELCTGIKVRLPVDIFFDRLESASIGAVFSLAYFSSLRREFAKSRET